MSPEAARPIVAAGALLVLSVIGFLFVWLGLPEMQPPCVFSQAILCAEFPSDGANLATTLTAAPNGPDLFRANIWIDFPFLAAYTCMLAVAAHEWKTEHPKIARAAFVFALAAAFFDISENLGLLSAIASLETRSYVGDRHALWIGLSAHLKFLALELSVAGNAFLAARRSKNIGEAAFLACTAVITLVGFGAIFDPRFVEAGALGTALMLTFLSARAAWSLRPIPT